MTTLQQPHDRPQSRSKVVLLAFLAIGGFFLITEHAAWGGQFSGVERT